MAGRFTLFTNVLEEQGVVLTSGTSIDVDNPLDNLLNPLPTRPVVFDSETSAEIIINKSAIVAGKDKVTDIIIWNHNIATDATILVQANPSNSWGSPAFATTFTVPADNETDPDYLSLVTGFEAGMIERYRSIKKLLIKLGSEVGSANDFMRILITTPFTVDDEGIYIAKLGVCYEQEFEGNYNMKIVQTFKDYSFSEKIKSGMPVMDVQPIGDSFKFDFDYAPRLDARKVAYHNLEQGKRYCFIALEPDNTNDWGEMRRHTFTMYGELDIANLNKHDADDHEYTATFEEAVTNKQFAVSPLELAYVIGALYDPSSPPSLPTGELTIPFTGVAVDPHEMLDIVTDATKVICKSTGVYELVAEGPGFNFASSSDGNCWIRILIDGVELVRATHKNKIPNSGSNAQINFHIGTLKNITAGQEVTLIIGHSRAASITLTSGRIRLHMRKLPDNTPHFRLLKTSSQTITIGAAGANPTYNSAELDTDGFYNGTDGIVIPTGLDGDYMLYGHMVWAADSDGYRQLSTSSGTASSIDRRDACTSAHVCHQCIGGVLEDRVAGNTVKLVTAHVNTGSNLNINSGEFCGYLIKAS